MRTLLALGGLLLALLAGCTEPAPPAPTAPSLPSASAVESPASWVELARSGGYTGDRWNLRVDQGERTLLPQDRTWLFEQLGDPDFRALDEQYVNEQLRDGYTIEITVGYQDGSTKKVRTTDPSTDRPAVLTGLVDLVNRLSRQ
ncbi:hypothetical protein [Amycolatopsis nigrescens]|uniref:hypothetical protein n=1 Tax=Amycolatopsis nigrescens TaxID=381445 RepID=UPI0003617908|nr:hypothetical protein [Amycolatopsis nigrescens]